jgi:penicillin-binding protein 1A
VWRWVKRLIVATLALVGLAVIALLLVLRHYERDLPSTAELRHYAPPQVTRVLARDGSPLGEVFSERRTVVGIDAIAREMKLAVLAAEDAEFYRHEGLDYLGMLRALVVNLRHGSMRQGGSTITQQVVKNVLLTPERTFERKAREVLLARRIEQQLSKDEILELYLNHIWFGHGRYGVEEAARYYFGKGARRLSLAEAALLAGVPKAPNVYSPRIDPVKARQRRDHVLEQMAQKGFAARAEVEQAKAEPIVLAPAVDKLAELAPEAVAEAQKLLAERVGPAARKGGFTITTTIDPKLQAAARSAVRRNLDDFAERHQLVGPLRRPRREPRTAFVGTPKPSGHHVYLGEVTGADDAHGLLRVRVGTSDGVVRLAEARRYNPKDLPPSRFAEPGVLLRVSAVSERGVDDDGVPHEFRLELGPQSALVAIDLASREIRALVGGYEAVRGALDRASQAHRQPGSTFKPFVYSYAIHSRRLTAASVVEPVSAAPADAGAPARPPLLLRPAVARSVNDAAVWALKDVGAEPVVSWAQTLGIQSKLAPTESLALGAYEVTPRELAGAYASIASGGLFEEPVLIERVVGPDGKDVPLPARPPPRRVMDEAEAYVVTDLLTSVIRGGTGQRARVLDLPLAGKTGTSNDARDAWFAGYSPETLCVVWTGYDDSQPLGGREQGATAALPAFIELMRAAHAGRRPRPWPQPDGVVRVRIDPATGLLAYPGQSDAAEEVFLAGTEPTEVAVDPDAGVDAGPADGAAGAEGGTMTPPPAQPDGGIARVGPGEPPPF